MKRDVLQQASEYTKVHRRKKRWLKVVTCLAAVVVFCTTYALILPAITMEKSDCEIPEHTHTQECYTQVTSTTRKELVCSPERLKLHEHTEDCYDEDDQLICGYADFVVHTHDDSCYDEDGTLWCPLPEIEAHTHENSCYADPADGEKPVHTHTDGCYTMERGALICEIEEGDGHQHTDACYEWEKVLTCEQSTEPELICDKEEIILHEHTEECFDEEDRLICGQMEVLEHVHSEDCFQNVEVPVDTETLTCTLPEDENHTHGPLCYGTWELTCGKEEHTHSAECQGTFDLTEEEQTRVDEVIALIDALPTSEEVEEKLTAYDDAGDKEGYEKYHSEVSHQAREAYLLYEDIGPDLQAHVTNRDKLLALEWLYAAQTLDNRNALEVESQSKIPVSADCHYEDDNISVVLHVEGEAVLPEEKSEEEVASERSDTTVESVDSEVSHQSETEGEDVGENASEEGNVQDASTEEPVLSVTGLSEEDAEYQELEDYAKKNSGEDTFYDLSAMSYTLSYQGQKMDLSDCDVTAEITPKKAMLKGAEPVFDTEEEIAPEAEVGVVLTALQNVEEETVTLDSALVTADAGQKEDAATMTVELDSSTSVLAVSASQTANPNFTVQYYANLDVAATTGENPLDVIDTSNKKLPKNGETPTTKQLYLKKDVGNQKYKVSTEMRLTEVYQQHQYEYITAPNLTYFNRLYENGNYKLKEIWILNEGKNANSTDSRDWTAYSPDTHFTNRSESAKDGTVLIKEGTVIRLVFDTTESVYTNSVNFYDYDITDNGKNTEGCGINSAANYSGTGSKLAFGNMNTGTGLGMIRWDGNYLNKYNAEWDDANHKNGNAIGYKGCTFGLVSSLNNGKIQYAAGVSAPNLFNEGSAKGKNSYDNAQYTLAFNRVGDTYTLSSVPGATLTGLEYFNHPGAYSIWTNNFWPMDDVTNKDPHTGKTGNTGTYTGADGTEKGKYPPSDDGLAHNNMFGMQYAVQFKLTEDYSGPLEYYFFGDDDMWVFLDNQLVCDIGGVHSSVGEYVNLWDYVQKGRAETHTLTFFYTERGLSGSTCYMQFTLPSVSSITPEQNTGLLTVQKLVEGASNSDEEFHFKIKFTDKDGNNLPDDYSYTRYDKDGNVIKQDVIIFDGGSFELKAGEYVIIKYLPYGTQYTITETDIPAYYTVAYQVDSGGRTDGDTANGQIESGNSENVVFTNTAMPMLPETGGTGTLLYMCSGLALMLASVLMYKILRKRREEMQ